MIKKLLSYLRFGKNKPEYHIEGSAYGGLRIDIDKYYQEPKHQEELKEINQSNFGKMFDHKGNKKRDKEQALER
ncbi:hypothetical protein [Gracilimonas sediminicola]|uniref:hypothetical protein n=1 Tax=Gracilimonas sediminicola TaxID=2952158 RepID=UPI0038D4F486